MAWGGGWQPGRRHGCVSRIHQDDAVQRGGCVQSHCCAFCALYLPFSFSVKNRRYQPCFICSAISHTEACSLSYSLALLHSLSCSPTLLHSLTHTSSPSFSHPVLSARHTNACVDGRLGQRLYREQLPCSCGDRDAPGGSGGTGDTRFHRARGPRFVQRQRGD